MEVIDAKWAPYPPVLHIISPLLADRKSVALYEYSNILRCGAGGHGLPQAESCSAAFTNKRQVLNMKKQNAIIFFSTVSSLSGGVGVNVINLFKRFHTCYDYEKG